MCLGTLPEQPLRGKQKQGKRIERAAKPFHEICRTKYTAPAPAQKTHTFRRSMQSTLPNSSSAIATVQGKWALEKQCPSSTSRTGTSEQAYEQDFPSASSKIVTFQYEYNTRRTRPSSSSNIGSFQYKCSVQRYAKYTFPAPAGTLQLSVRVQFAKCTFTCFLGSRLLDL